MKKLYIKLCLLILSIGLNSCFSEKFEYIGKKQVLNKPDWIVKFYQLDKFEVFTPVRYEITNKDGSLISERHRLTSADANLQNVNNFYVKVQDSILYICYPYPKVVAIKHISNLDKPNQWDLIKKLYRRDTSLYRRYK